MKPILFITLFLIFCIQGQSQGKKEDNKSANTKAISKEDYPEAVAFKQSESGDTSKTPLLTFEQVVTQSNPIIEQKPNGNVNWSEQFIEAKGQSVIDTMRFKMPAQAKLMASRGAIVVAQRNLLEIVQGVNVTSETTVKDMITQSDFIYTRIDGVVKGAIQIGDAVEKDGFMEVTMRIPMYSEKGIAPVVYENVPGINKKKNAISEVASEVIESGDLGGAEGLVFNFNGKKYDPSMFPVVVDEKSDTLLNLLNLYDPNSGKFPQVLQTSKSAFQKLGISKGVEVIDVVQTLSGNIQVDSANAGKINWEKIGKYAKSASKVIKFALALI